MKEENDKKILNLIEVVKEKRVKIKLLKSEIIPFKTSQVFDFDGHLYNLNVCTIEALNFILIKLSMYQREAKNLELDFTIDGFPIDDLIADVKTNLRKKDIIDKERSLKQMEKTLDSKLSEDTKTRLDLDSLSDSILNMNV